MNGYARNFRGLFHYAFDRGLGHDDSDEPDWLNDPEVCPPYLDRKSCIATVFTVDLTLIAAALECSDDDMDRLMEILLNLLETGGSEEYMCASGGIIRLTVEDEYLEIQTEPPIGGD